MLTYPSIHPLMCIPKGLNLSYWSEFKKRKEKDIIIDKIIVHMTFFVYFSYASSLGEKTIIKESEFHMYTVGKHLGLI